MQTATARRLFLICGSSALPPTLRLLDIECFVCGHGMFCLCLNLLQLWWFGHQDGSIWGAGPACPRSPFGDLRVSLLDYCNPRYAGLPLKTAWELEQIQNLNTWLLYNQQICIEHHHWHLNHLSATPYCAALRFSLSS